MARPDLLRCPHCLGPLSEGPESWACAGCARSFRALRGIPDLRTFDDPFLPNDRDWDYAQALDRDYDRLDFRGLLDRYFDLSPEIPPDQRGRQIAHILTAPGRARQWLDALGPIADGAPLLDLGCGSGSFLAAAGRRRGATWGLDIALRWLIVARKRLDEEGLAHIRLACGCAERLPFAERSFAAIVAGDMIEHVSDQATTLAEARRALAGGGRLVMASPNRFSLAPEPHVGVWGVGFLPRGWMASYVFWRRKLDFRAIRTLHYGEWKRLLGESPFGGGEIWAPRLHEVDLQQFAPLKRDLARIYNACVRHPAGQAIALRVGPLFHITCTRTADGRRPSRPTRRRSRPSATPG